VKQFGTFNAHTKTYAIDPVHTSLLSSLAFIGKFIGCLIAGPAVERFGHRVVFFGLSVVSVIGIISELRRPLSWAF
jgi:SP family sugar:H+ symporter-like MFS transporter